MGQLPFETIKRGILTRKRCKTDSKYGGDPYKRPVEQLIKQGVININKPPGPTSHIVADHVKQIFNIKKAGHSGTLDPGVTGVLPIALDRATRVTQVLLPAGKEYVAIMHLHKPVDLKLLKKTLREFIGKIEQLPPIRSAVKRRLRKRIIYYLEILEVEKQDVLFRIGCQAGTYIRKLCLHSKTEIMSKQGLISAQEFYSNPKTTYTFNNGRLIEKNPSAVQKIRSPTKLRKITMSSGVSFVVTPDHELLKSSITAYKMTETKKLKKGDYLIKSITFPSMTKDYVISDLLDDRFLIAQPKIKQACRNAFIKKYRSIRAMNRALNLDRKAFLSKSENAITIKHLKLAGIYDEVKHNITTFKTEKGAIIELIKLNSQLFYLLGLIASDGSNTKEKNTVRYTRLKFHNKNEVLINKFLENYKRLFPNIPISKKKVRNNLFQLDTSNSFFATIAASFGVKSPQKDSDILPILYSRPELIKAFLKGYFDGDGTAYFKKKINVKRIYTSIRLFSVSYTNAKRLHQMLLKIGIPNKIFQRKDLFIVSLETTAANKKFMKIVGSNHPKKIEIFDKILGLNSRGIEDCYYIGLHFKKFIRKNKSRLYKLGGNLSRVLKEDVPLTRGFYKRASTLIKLPLLDDFVIEKIKSIEEVSGADYVYDMTIPETHNFLIETGFVSSNCHDIGRKLNTGAHMAQLIRTKAGPFTDKDMVYLQDLTDALWYWKNKKDEKPIRKIIHPIEYAINHIPKVWINDLAVDTVCHGADLKIPGICKLHDDIKKDDVVAIMTLKDELVAFGKARLSSEETILNEKGLAVKSHKVFMEPDVYPKFKK